VDPIADGLLEAMRSELGYKEGAGQYTKFGEWYSDTVADPQYKNAPWCDMFIAWAAEKADVQGYVGQFAWTPSHAKWFQRQGAWSDTPEPGALVFYDWAGSKKAGKVDHVGVVEKVENGKLHTIEANVDKVWLKRKIRDESKVVGYGLPRKVHEMQVQAGSLERSTEPRQMKAPLVGAPREQAVTIEALGHDRLPAVFSPEGVALTGGITALVLGSVMVMTRASARRRSTGTPGRHRRQGRHHRIAM
jgi:CHAP domain